MQVTDIVGIEVSRGTVQSDWIDINGHMNVAYYVLAFDRAVDDFWGRLGITDEYIDVTRGSTFAVENHVIWLQEMNEGDPYVVTTQLLAYDAKRIHQFQRMYHEQQRYLAATAEWMNLHVDLELRKVTAWPDFVRQNLEGYAKMQAGLPAPAAAGNRMMVKNPLYAAASGGAGD